jgi:hypothetical protein
MRHRVPFHLGERLWLTPNTPGAPGVAYQQPEVEVVAVGQVGSADYGQVTVRLPDGAEIGVSRENLRRTRPRPPTEPAPRRARRPVLDLAPNEREVPLWS